MVEKMESQSSFFAGFLIGTFAGIAFGILYAPKRGKELKELLKNKTERSDEKLQDAPETAV